MKEPINKQKQRITNTTLRLIEESGGALNVNLRQVAREVNCSAPNIYNYFRNFDSLLNTVLIKICDDFTTTMQKDIAEASSPENIISVAFTSFISYIVYHPARINFFYFEKLGFDVYANTHSIAEDVGNNMSQLLLIGTDNALSQKTANEVSSILHWYIIGQLSEYVTGRVGIDDKEKYITDLLATCKSLLQKYM